MQVPLFLKAMVVGFSIAAPVGAIGLLCIRRTLHEGFAAGIITGFGAALADTLYALIAAFGLTSALNLLDTWKEPMRIGGGLVLLLLAWKAFYAPAAREKHVGIEMPALKNIASTFVLTLMNPTTILSFIALFAGFGLVAGHDIGESSLIVGGVFSGAMAWWIMLSGFVARARARARAASVNLSRLNRITGILLAFFGLGALLTGLL